MRSAVAYIRVSRADKKRGLTLDLQLEAITTYAERSGVALVETYVDEGKSAYTNRIDKRPAFQRLLREAQGKGRPWSLVLVYKTDRFARDALLQLQCRRDLLKLGVRTESATQHNPDDSAIGKLNVVLDAGLNEYYSALLSDRMRDVRRFEASQQGRHVGPIPVGFDRRDGRLITNERAAAVLLAGQLYATGQHSAARIADALNAAGHTNAEGEPFKVYAVEEMLKNPVYAGFVVCDGQRYQGAHDPIWDAALWARMQEVAAQRSRRRTRPAVRHDPLLAGLIYCAHCGAPMWHFPRDGWRSYRCNVVPSKRPGPIAGLACDDTWAHAENVEAAVLAWVGALGAVPELLERARAKLAQARPATPVGHELELRRLKQQFLADQIGAAAYEERRAELLAQKPPQAAPIDDSAVLALIGALPTLLERATPGERRAVLGQLLSGVYARRKAVLAFRPTRLAYALFSAAAATPDWRDAVLTNSGHGGPGGHLTSYATICKNEPQPVILLAA